MSILPPPVRKFSVDIPCACGIPNTAILTLITITNTIVSLCIWMANLDKSALFSGQMYGVLIFDQVMHFKWMYGVYIVTNEWINIDTLILCRTPFK